MTFEWSAHAKHIQTLYAPWTPEDGYSEEALCATEARLGIALPSMLRLFYRYWGKRKGLIDARETILPLEEIMLWNEALVFCVEDQGVFYWGTREDELKLENPPVWYAYNEDTFLGWQLGHTCFSHFLDSLSYHQAFSGGASHGAISRAALEQKQKALIQYYWQKRDIEAVPWGVYPSAYPHPHCWTIYTQEGQALNWGPLALWVAVRNEDDLPQIAQLLGVEWEKTW